MYLKNESFTQYYGRLLLWLPQPNASEQHFFPGDGWFGPVYSMRVGKQRVKIGGARVSLGKPTVHYSIRDNANKLIFGIG